MSSPFLAEIRIFAGNFAPTGWATCDGQLLPISQNTALFSLLGTTYGGDGKSTFALPNLDGRAAVAPGQGPGLSLYDLGEETGSTQVTMLSNNVPSHSHGIVGDDGVGDTTVAAGHLFGAARRGQQPKLYSTTLTGLATMSSRMIGLNGPNWSGGATPFNIMQPSLVLTFIIALQGIFPSRP